jgi:gliding motility associated protien GldN
MKTLIILNSFLFVNILLIAQGNIGPSNVIIPTTNPGSGVIDGVYEKKDVLAKKRAIPYEFVRENDYVWGKRTWSYIDLREKINHPLYFPLEELDKNEGTLDLAAQGRYSLYFILKTAMEKGQIMGYFDAKIVDLDDLNNTSGNQQIVLKDKFGGDAFIMPAQRDYTLPVSSDVGYRTDIGKMVGTVTKTSQKEKEAIDPATSQNTYVFHLKGQDPNKVKIYTAKDRDLASVVDPSTETLDPLLAELDAGGKPAMVSYKIIITEYVQPKQIVKYLLKEDWFFDKERSILDVRIIGLAPVIQTDSSENILFWVYFPQARDVLKNYYVYDAKSTVGGNTFDHLFMTRRFNAVVYKESSLYDRKIEDYRFGADALYESEKVKNTIRTFEHDVWNF